MTALKAIGTGVFVGAAALFAAGAAHAQAACMDDNPPEPVGGPVLSCANIASCPSSDEVDTETLSYKHADNVGSCGGEGAFCPSNCTDSRASCIVNADGTEASAHCEIDLVGVLYTPKKAPKKGPAVVLVPGSTVCNPGLFDPQPFCQTTCGTDSVGHYPPETFCGFKSYLVERGYRIFWMYPRGYTDRSRGSTGVYVGTRAQEQIDRSDACAVNNPGEEGAACSAVDLEQEGSEDVADAIKFIAARDDVTSVAVLGHSYGGIRTLAANASDNGQKAVVEIAAGSESWCLPTDTTTGSAGGSSNGAGIDNTVLQSRLLKNVDDQQSRILFMQPHNDVDLNSTIELSHRAGVDRFQFEASIFPPVLDVNGKPFTFGDVAHGCFIDDETDVKRWAPVAVNFIARYGVK